MDKALDGMGFVRDIVDGQGAGANSRPRTIDAAFEARKDRFEIAPAPTDCAGGAPIVEIGGQPPKIDQGVDRAGSADDPPARPIGASVIGAGVWFGMVFPVDAFIEERPPIADRGLDPKTPVMRAGLEHEHAHPAVFRKTIGQGAAGRAGPHNDDIECLHAGLIKRSAGLASPSSRLPMMEPSRRQIKKNDDPRTNWMGFDSRLALFLSSLVS
jgi:hypothetical protein